jgi:hypothetical protein
LTIVRLRTEVVDERGRLGALASAIAAYGGNILEIDVHLLDGAHVADEFVVDFPGGHAADALGTALRRAGGTQFLLQRLDEHVVVDPIVRAIDGCARLFEGRSPDWGLEAAVASVVVADAVQVVPAGAAARSPVVSRAGEERAPACAREWLLTAPREGEEPPWALAVPDPNPSADGYVVVERAAPAFSSSEIARVSAVLRLAHLASSTPDPAGQPSV